MLCTFIHLFLQDYHGIPIFCLKSWQALWGGKFNIWKNSIVFNEIEINQVCNVVHVLSRAEIPGILRRGEESVGAAESTRQIERGSRIITAIPHDVRLVLQVRRYCHPLVQMVLVDVLHMYIFAWRRCQGETWRPSVLEH